MNFYQEASYMSPGGTQAVLHDIHHCDVLTFHLGERVLTNKKLHISACGKLRMQMAEPQCHLGSGQLGFGITHRINQYLHPLDTATYAQQTQDVQLMLV